MGMIGRRGVLNMYDAFIFLAIILMASGIILTYPFGSGEGQRIPPQDAENILHTFLHTTIDTFTYRSRGNTITLENVEVIYVLKLYTSKERMILPSARQTIAPNLASLTNNMGYFCKFIYELGGNEMVIDVENGHINVEIRDSIEGGDENGHIHADVAAAIYNTPEGGRATLLIWK